MPPSKGRAGDNNGSDVERSHQLHHRRPLECAGARALLKFRWHGSPARHNLLSTGSVSDVKNEKRQSYENRQYRYKLRDRVGQDALAADATRLQPTDKNRLHGKSRRRRPRGRRRVLGKNLIHTQAMPASPSPATTSTSIALVRSSRSGLARFRAGPSGGAAAAPPAAILTEGEEEDSRNMLHRRWCRSTPIPSTRRLSTRHDVLSRPAARLPVLYKRLMYNMQIARLGQSSPPRWAARCK